MIIKYDIISSLLLNTIENLVQHSQLVSFYHVGGLLYGWRGGPIICDENWRTDLPESIKEYELKEVYIFIYMLNYKYF